MLLQSSKDLFLLPLFLFCGFKSDPAFGLDAPQADQQNVHLHSEEKEETPVTRLENYPDEKERPVFQYFNELSSINGRFSAENKKAVAEEHFDNKKEDTIIFEPSENKKNHRLRLTSKNRKFDWVEKKSREYIDDYYEEQDRNTDEIKKFKFRALDDKKKNIKDFKNTGRDTSKKNSKNSNKKTSGNDDSGRRIVTGPRPETKIDIRIQKSVLP